MAPQLTLVGAGNPTSTGFVVSTKVVVCEAEVMLPQASVTLHVLTIEYPQVAGTVLADNETERSLSQLSMALTTASGTGCPHCNVALAGTPISVGAMMSLLVNIL